MSTFNGLVTLLASDLRDPANKTFDTTMLGELITEAAIEINRIAPSEFQTDITVVADTLVYTVGTGDRNTSLRRVEVWDISVTPNKLKWFIPPAAAEYSQQSQTGWYMWGGQLYLPNGLESKLVVGTHVIRVWGYAPYALVTGTTEMPQPTDLEYAIRRYARLLGKKQLLAARDLFTQWQFASNNTDITPAHLLAEIGAEEASWERYQRRIMVIRENP